MKKRKLKILGVAILLAVLAASMIWALIPNPFHDRVQALLNDTGAICQIRECSGGWFSREMHSEIEISPSELEKLITGLGLVEPLSSFRGQTRLILVDHNTNPCASDLRVKYRPAFDVQQWSPSRHGFASVIVFFNSRTERACVYLSLAYG